MDARRWIGRGIGAAAAGGLALAVAACSPQPAGPPQPQSTGAPTPVPATDAVLSLPKDMYLHLGAPSEWWWNIGTLRSGDRIFGFEINAAAFPVNGWAFTQIMLTDVESGKHYQATTPYLPPGNWDPQHWAESDPSKDWRAVLGDPGNALGGIHVTNPGSGYSGTPAVTITGDGHGASAIATVGADGGISQIVVVNPGSGYTSPPEIAIGGTGTGATAAAYSSFVSMSAPAGDPTQDISTEAQFSDEATLTPVAFDLAESEVGDPFMVWGTGVNSTDPALDLQQKNYYFSLTRLATSGTITLDGETIPVTGETWMDHEYGVFGTSANPVKWNLVDMQLDNGWTMSTFFTVSAGQIPPEGEPHESFTTLQSPDGEMYYVASDLTPLGPMWTSAMSGDSYYTGMRVRIPLFDAELTATARVDGQEFPVVGSPVYEGIGGVDGTFEGVAVTGDGWIEQAH